MRAPDGRAALPVFTDVEAMAQWSGSARPIPAEGPRAALAAISEGWSILVVNPSRETVVIPRPAVWALGQGVPWRPAVVDGRVVEELREAIGESLTRVPGVIHADAVPGTTAEVAVVLSLRAGMEREELDGVLASVRQALAELEIVAERVDGLEVRVLSA